MSDSEQGDRGRRGAPDLVQAIDELGALIERRSEVLGAPRPQEQPSAAAAPAEVPLLIDVVKPGRARGAPAASRPRIADMFEEGPGSDAPCGELERLRQELIADLGALVESHLAALRRDVERVLRARFEAASAARQAPPEGEPGPSR